MREIELKPAGYDRWDWFEKGVKGDANRTYSMSATDVADAVEALLTDGEKFSIKTI